MGIFHLTLTSVADFLSFNPGKIASFKVDFMKIVNYAHEILILPESNIGLLNNEVTRSSQIA